MNNKSRQINITDQYIIPIEPIFKNDNELEIMYELWFNVDKYFGTDTIENDNLWINFYTIYNKNTDKITSFYEIDSPDSVDTFKWELTKEEQIFFRELLEKYCMREYNLSLIEYFNTYC